MSNSGDQPARSDPHNDSRWLALLAAVFYTILVLVQHSEKLVSDEPRYYQDALHLAKQGFFLSAERPEIINGPGYPWVLTPLVAADAPVWTLRMLNAVFMWVAVICIHRAALVWAGRGWAAAVALAVMFHPAQVKEGGLLMTEALTTCLVAAFALLSTRLLRADKAKAGLIVGTAAVLAYLTMTRTFFGYVTMASIVLLGGAMLIFRRSRPQLLRGLAVTGLAFMMCIPWLVYAKEKTGRVCWSTTGGELLYWLTSHHGDENGRWYSVEDAMSRPDLVPNHRAFHEKILATPPLEREAVWKAQAMEHVRDNPKRVALNWVSNVSRLFFGFPRGLEREEISTLALVLANGPVLLLTGAALIVAVLRRREMPPGIVMPGMFAAVYLGGSSCAPCLPRYSVVILPLVMLFTAAVFSRFVRVRLVGAPEVKE